MPSLIIPRLYLSNLLVARDEAQLTSLGATHVISVMNHAPKFPSSLPHLKTLLIPIEDSPQADILQYLEQTTQFIKDALSENDTNVVLVHCLMGMSRSATVVCAYLVATTSMLPSESISYVTSKRSIVCPNSGFLRQLDTYAMRYYGKGQKSKGLQIRMGIGVGERIRRLMHHDGGVRFSETTTLRVATTDDQTTSAPKTTQ
ncbi:hypothetical protein CERSUDRAFT_152359 [Gelatoporia subvermispora B]|uniref:Uncharacterized protein n=1 Tax=Ceriporiopsis subvermispora (strain B) TaxID=914234 RepID=M2PRN0_CERS8|nr:hypothetical protein CERSUDRAFT_152359 [Gelatoporia subvermispora B]